MKIKRSTANLNSFLWIQKQDQRKYIGHHNLNEIITTYDIHNCS
jgi:hypothetical protein